MARLFTSGFESQILSTSAATSGESVVKAGTVAINTSVPRSGAACAEVAPSGLNYVQQSITSTLGRSYFYRFAFRISAFPAATAGICRIADSTNTILEISVTPAGKIEMWNPVAAAHPAGEVSPSISTEKWFVVEVLLRVNAAGNGKVAWRLDGTTIATEQEMAVRNIGANTFRVGNFMSSPITIFTDDIAVNDDQGTAENSWCGNNRQIVMLKPISDVARTGFTGGAGGASNLFDAVNNAPPLGVVLGSATDLTQVKDANNNSTDSFEVNLGAYGLALNAGGGGMIAADSIKLISGIMRGGQSSATARSLGLTLISNPAATEVTGTLNAETAGTEPTGWKTIAASVIYAPTVTVGTSPVVKVRKATATTDAVMVDLVGLLVEYEPGTEKPTATTEAATEITGTGAVINGAVDPNRQATTYWFEYSTNLESLELGSGTTKTAEESAGEGTTAIAKAKTVSSLTNGTKYYFRMVAKNATGTTKGAILNFTTLKTPTVASEPVTETSNGAANLQGLVNPNSTATNAWFEWGRTKDYGNKTVMQSAGSGSADIGIHEIIGKLRPGTLYHYRVVGESSAGISFSADETFVTTGTKVTRDRKPDLALDVEVETPDGTFRLPSDSKKARNLPRNLSFGTNRGEGYGQGSLNLGREIFREYPDIGLLDTWRAISRSGRTVYEGRLQSNPRTNDPEEMLEIALIGWMSYLAGKKVSPLIVDSRLGSWTNPSVQRRANLVSGARPHKQDATVAWDTSIAALHFEVQNGWSSPIIPVCEAWFNAGTEIIGAIYADWVNGWSDLIFELYVRFCQDAVATGYEGSSDYYSAQSGHISQVPANPAGKNFAFITWLYGATPAGSEGGQYGVDLTHLKVVGAHGLTRQGAWPEVGYYLTDILRYLLETYFPKVTLAGDKNTFVVQQATWHDSAQTGYEIFKQLNNLALWEMNMWEDRTLHHEPADLTKYDWQFKTTDEGVRVKFQGDSIENFANGCSVQYTDFDGTTHILYPSDHIELRDESENNPYNKHGEDGWTDCDVPYQCNEAEALQFGRVYLAEFNRPKRPGSYEIQGGYIRDAAGNWHAGFDVHNGETCGIMDLPDDEPRLITSTNWDDESKVLTINVDAPDKLLDAIVARQQIARETRGL